MSSVYHVLYDKPALEKDDMFIGLENMAQALVASGRLRIEDSYRINFTRFTMSEAGVTIMFSHRELSDPELFPATERILSQLFMRYKRLKGAALAQKVRAEMRRLRKELEKYNDIDAEAEIKLARVVVQSTHPSVMKLLLLEGTEVYVSYSYEIGGMLDIQSWQTSGSNSGMQSTDGLQTAVFVAAGGNPFIENEQEDAIYGDGDPALARMMIIGAQELGHYADIKRDRHGRQISRYSTNFASTRTKQHVREGRIRDIAHIKKIRHTLNKIYFDQIVELERQQRFFDEQDLTTAKARWVRFLVKRKGASFFKKLAKTPYHPFIEIAKRVKYPVSQISIAMNDTLVNLAPQADVYKRDNPIEEEAIACVEAVARVPQQAIKWGHPTIQILMRNLYEVYYKEIIPGTIKAYQDISGKKYAVNMVKPRLPLWKKIYRGLKYIVGYLEKKQTRSQNKR